MPSSRENLFGKLAVERKEGRGHTEVGQAGVFEGRAAKELELLYLQTAANIAADKAKAHKEMEFRAMTRNHSHLSSESRLAGSACEPETRPLASNGPASPCPPVDRRVWERVLTLWLEWNEADEQLTEKLFIAGSDLHRIEAIMDQADRLRIRATELSRQLLATGEADLDV